MVKVTVTKNRKSLSSLLDLHSTGLIFHPILVKLPTGVQKQDTSDEIAFRGSVVKDKVMFTKNRNSMSSHR